MTKQQMEQLRNIPSEISAIENTLANPKMEYVNMYYKDYRTGKGVPKSRSEYAVDQSEIKRLKKRLRKKVIKLRRLLADAEVFIDSIEDIDMRVILRSYYINGQTQEDVARLMHYDRSTVSKKLDRFWADHSHNSHKKGDII